MKKIRYILISLVALLLVTGCGSKNANSTLTCTKEQEDTGMKISEKHVMTFENDKVSLVDLKIDFVADDENVKTNWDSIVEILNQQFVYDDYEGVEFSKSSTSDSYTWALKVDLNKVSDEALDALDLNDVADSNEKYDDVKKDFEADGYTCK